MADKIEIVSMVRVAFFNQKVGNGDTWLSVFKGEDEDAPIVGLDSVKLRLKAIACLVDSLQKDIWLSEAFDRGIESAFFLGSQEEWAKLRAHDHGIISFQVLNQSHD